MKEHLNLTLCVNAFLTQMKLHAAKLWEGRLDLEDIEYNRHYHYDEEHPVSVVLPFLNLTKVHIYLGGFPGLHEKVIGE
jgi:hypothetical protein